MARPRSKVYSTKASSSRKRSRRSKPTRRRKSTASRRRVMYDEPMYMAPLPPRQEGTSFLGTILTLLVFAAIGVGVYIAVTPGVTLDSFFRPQTTTAAANTASGWGTTLLKVLGFGAFGVIVVFGGRELYSRYIVKTPIVGEYFNKVGEDLSQATAQVEESVKSAVPKNELMEKLKRRRILPGNV